MNMDNDDKFGWVSDYSTKELVEKVKKMEKLSMLEFIMTHILRKK